jgi:hypothetical protein
MEYKLNHIAYKNKYANCHTSSTHLATTLDLVRMQKEEGTKRWDGSAISIVAARHIRMIRAPLVQLDMGMRGWKMRKLFRPIAAYYLTLSIELSPYSDMGL